MNAASRIDFGIAVRIIITTAIRLVARIVLLRLGVRLTIMLSFLMAGKPRSSLLHLLPAVGKVLTESIVMARITCKLEYSNIEIPA